MATTSNPNLSDHDRRLLDGLFDECEAERAERLAAEEPEPAEEDGVSEAMFCERLAESLWLLDAEDELNLGLVESFSDRGLLTSNQGLVVRLASGEEFQLQVRRSN